MKLSWWQTVFAACPKRGKCNLENSEVSEDAKGGKTVSLHCSTCNGKWSLFYPLGWEQKFLQEPTVIEIK